MGLLKATKSKLYNIPLLYHRISTIYEEINQETRIRYKSYISYDDRLLEISGESVFTEESDIPVDGPPRSMTVNEAYTWLKAQPEFEGAEDILDDIS